MIAIQMKLPNRIWVVDVVLQLFRSHLSKLRYDDVSLLQCRYSPTLQAYTLELITFLVLQYLAIIVVKLGRILRVQPRCTNNEAISTFVIELLSQIIPSTNYHFISEWCHHGQ
jgi:putative component of membrane protein insertase Oxa1/YidC/SpoIIIJ protein YidD